MWPRGDFLTIFVSDVEIGPFWLQWRMETVNWKYNLS